MHPGDVDDAFVREQLAQGLKGIILSGSHASAYEEGSMRVPHAVFELGVPVLGICYGMQSMAQQLGGVVSFSDHREFGYAEVRAHGTKLDGLADFTTDEGHGMLKVWMSHGDKVTALPPGFKLMASTPSCPIAGMADEDRKFYAVQFHPEVTHTVQGKAMLSRFVNEICGCQGDWNMPDYVAEAVARIREQVGDDEVILAVRRRGFSVAAALIHRPSATSSPAFRRPRPAAPGRRQAGHADLRREHGRQDHPHRRDRPVHGQAVRRGRSRSQAQDHRP